MASQKGTGEQIMTGRIQEKQILEKCLRSEQSEFVVIYGRRRVGKTFLVKEYFNQTFSFYSTGLANQKTDQQLRAFHESLCEYGYTETIRPKDWFEAFSRLKRILSSPDVRRDPINNKIVVFLDELPWMDTARSDFRSALEYFWNGWASSQKDILLIVCGSATSWIIDHLIDDRGGFYNRITCRIHLRPFSLSECRELINERGLVMSEREIMECYMVFGGIPFYINLLDERLSLAQNINELCFNEYGQLYSEHRHLFRSLFKNHELHTSIMLAMSKKKSGMTRAEMATKPGISDGAPLTRALNELEQCGFIRKYKSFTSKKNGAFYQITDPFSLFCITFLMERKVGSWMAYIDTPGYYSWRGNAFEILCLNHIGQIKNALGISGIESMECSWRSRTSDPGAQIDLLIDRKDGVINVCEMKYTTDPFSIDKNYEHGLQYKMSCFRNETGCNKALRLTMITNLSPKQNSYFGIVQNEITAGDLFEK